MIEKGHLAIQEKMNQAGRCYVIYRKASREVDNSMRALAMSRERRMDQGDALTIDRNGRQGFVSGSIVMLTCPSIKENQCLFAF